MVKMRARRVTRIVEHQVLAEAELIPNYKQKLGTCLLPVGKMWVEHFGSHINNPQKNLLINNPTKKLCNKSNSTYKKQQQNPRE